MSIAALGTIDMGGDGKTLLLAMIGKKLGETLSAEDYDFQDPETPIDASQGKNTMVRMYPKGGTGGYGPKVIYYDRINIKELGTVSIDKGSYTRVKDTLADINNKYGVYLTETDIVDADLPAADATGTVYFNIVINDAKSLVFYGNTPANMTTPIAVADFQPELTLYTSLLTNVGESDGHQLFTRTPLIVSCDIGAGKYKTQYIETPDAFNKVTRLANTGYFSRELALGSTQGVYHEDDYQREFPFLCVWRRSGISYGVSSDGNVYRTSTDNSRWYIDKTVYASNAQPGYLLQGARNKTNIVVLGSNNAPVLTNGASTIECTFYHYSTDTGDTWNTGTLPTSFSLSTKMDVVLDNDKLYIWNKQDTLVILEFIAKKVTLKSVNLSAETYTLPHSFIKPIDYSDLSGFRLMMEPETGKPGLFCYSRTTNSLIRARESGTSGFTVTALHLGRINPQPLNEAGVTDAYTVSLSPTSWLKVIQVPVVIEGSEDYISRLRVAQGNSSFLLDNMNKPLCRGIRVYTAVATAAGETAYTSTDLALSTRGLSKSVVVHDETNNYRIIHEAAGAISKLEFRWSDQRYGYLPTLKSITKTKDIGNISTLSSRATGAYADPVVVRKSDESYSVSTADIINAGTETHKYNFIVASTDALGAPNYDTSKWSVVTENTQVLVNYTDNNLEKTYLQGKVLFTHVSSYDNAGTYNRKVSYITNGNRVANKYNDFMQEVKPYGTSSKTVFSKINSVANERNLVAAFESGDKTAFQNTSFNWYTNTPVNIDVFDIDSFMESGKKDRIVTTHDVNGLHSGLTIQQAGEPAVLAAVSNKIFVDYEKTEGVWKCTQPSYIQKNNNVYTLVGQTGYTDKTLPFVGQGATKVEVIYISPLLMHMSKIERVIVTQETLTSGVVQVKLYEVTKATSANMNSPMTARRIINLNDSSLPPAKPITPVAGFVLWGSKTNTTVSIALISANGKVLFMDGFDGNGDVIWSWQSLIIPNDTGITMSAVPMHSNNLHEYFIQQPSNGIYKYKYTKNGIDPAVVTLDLVVSLAPMQIALSGSEYKAGWASLPDPV